MDSTLYSRHTQQKVKQSLFNPTIWLFFASLVMLFAKSPDALIQPQFWAEDGAIFFAQQFNRQWPPIFTPYAGYLNTVPRLVAWAATSIDYYYSPLFYNVCALLIDACCITFVTIRAGILFTRPVVFFSFFLVPSAGDIFGSITNVQWFMQFAIVVACLVPRDNDKQGSLLFQYASYFALALACLTGPFSVLVAALALGSILAGRIQTRISARRHIEPLIALLRAIGWVGQKLPKGTLYIVLICATLQAFVMFSSDVRTPLELVTLRPEQLQELNVQNHKSAYAEIVNRPTSPENAAWLLAMSAVLIACLFYTNLRPSLFSGLCCLLLALGTAQPILAYLKQRELHTLAATSHYFYLLGVVSCWVGWEMLRELRPHFRRHAACLLLTGIALAAVIRPQYFQREKLYDLGWSKQVSQIRSSGQQVILVPLNPLPWHFRLEDNEVARVGKR